MFLLYLLLVAALPMLVACGSEEPAETPLRPVRTLEVTATGGTRARTFAGVTRAGMESRLSFRVGGEVERLPVEVGDHVSPGELIAQLDATDHELTVEQRQAALAQARAAERKASADYQRVRQLYENENASRNDLDAARAAFESATAQVSSAEKALELARQQLSYTRLAAPIEADVARVDVEVNENVRAGQVVAVLASGDEFEVEVAIPEILIAQIREGDGVDVTFDAIPGETYAGVCTEVGVQPGGTATTFPVTVRLDSSDPDIRPGMAAEVTFHFRMRDEGDDEEHIVLPPVAVGEDRQGRFVFVVEEVEPGVGVVHRRPVRVGTLTTDGIEILGGVEEGEVVVTAGVSRIEEGMRVKLPGRTGSAS